MVYDECTSGGALAGKKQSMGVGAEESGMWFEGGLADAVDVEARLVKSALR